MAGLIKLLLGGGPAGAVSDVVTPPGEIPTSTGGGCFGAGPGNSDDDGGTGCVDEQPIMATADAPRSQADQRPGDGARHSIYARIVV